MDHPNLPAFPFPGFPQIIPALIEHEIMRVNRILAALPEFPTCDYDSPDSPCSCRNKATVNEIETGLGYCEGHFPEVERG